MLTLCDDDNIRVAVIEHASMSVTLCFTGIGHAIGGVDVQSEEFRNASNFSTTVFITDKQRSWGNNIDFNALAKTIAPYTNGKVIDAIGNSMGGFLAVLASKFFRLSAVVAFCPQYSVSKRIVPSERRYDRYVDKIVNWRFESLADCFDDATQYYIVAGLGGADDRQLELIPSRSNVHKIYFRHESFAHDVAQRLKRDGLLYGVIADCFRHMSASEIVANRQLLRDDYRVFIGS